MIRKTVLAIAAAMCVIGVGSAERLGSLSSNTEIPVLDGGGLIPAARLGIGTADSTRFLRGDRVFSFIFPIDDTTTLVRDPVDNSRLMRIDVGAVATATTRVLTMPDQDIDLTPGVGSFASEAEGALAVTALQDLIDDLSPQWGGDMDRNGFGIGDGSRLLLDFVEDPAAVNYLEIENEEIGSAPTIRAVGDDANIGLRLVTKGNGNLIYMPDAGNADVQMDVAAPQSWIIRVNNTTKEINIIDNTNSKTPFKAKANSNNNLFRIGATAGGQVDINGDLSVSGAVFGRTKFSILKSDGTLIAAAGVQTWAGTNNTAQDVFTVEANSTYRVRGGWIISNGTTAHSTAMAWALNGVTVTYFQYLVKSGGGGFGLSVYSVSGVSSTIVRSSNSVDNTIISFEGILVIGTGGTITPQIDFSANPGGTNLMKRGSWISFEKLGSDMVTTSGAWN